SVRSGGCKLFLASPPPHAASSSARRELHRGILEGRGAGEISAVGRSAEEKPQGPVWCFGDEPFDDERVERAPIIAVPPDRESLPHGRKRALLVCCELHDKPRSASTPMIETRVTS